MKSLFTIFFICLDLLSFSQTGNLKISITITDTTKPYFFLDIFLNKKDSLITKMRVTESGNFSIKDIEEGFYNLEFYSIDSRRVVIDSVHITKDSLTNIKTSYPPLCKYVYPKNYKPNCPYNHFDGIVKIVYGFPTTKTLNNAKKGLVHLGGCLTTYCDPKYYCTLHKLEF